MSPVAKFAMMKPPGPPYPHEFSLGHPTGISALDSDVIKLTAQYTAVNGRDFLAGLAQREIRNPQFDFLKPTHLLFSYFTSLVDAYAKILRPSKELKENLRRLQDKMTALELSVHRWSFTKDEAERRYRESAEADAEKIAFSGIDWHDFVVVETIDFPADESFEYGTTLGSAPLGLQAPSGFRGALVDTDDMDMDDDDVRGPPPNPPSIPPAARGPPPVLPAVSEDVDMEEEDDGEDMKIVADYQPRMASSQRTAGANMTMVDPLSGKAIPVGDMGEHLRVALLDPKWRVEQQRFQDKQRETGFAEGSSIADSLKQFAMRRGDIFAQKAGQETTEGEEAEAAQKPEVYLCTYLIVFICVC